MITRSGSICITPYKDLSQGYTYLFEDIDEAIANGSVAALSCGLILCYHYHQPTTPSLLPTNVSTKDTPRVGSEYPFVFELPTTSSYHQLYHITTLIA